MSSATVASDANIGYKGVTNLEVENILSVKGQAVIGYENNSGRIVPTARTGSANNILLTAAEILNNRVILCSNGASADYTITLPTAASFATAALTLFKQLRTGDYGFFYINNSEPAHQGTLTSNGDGDFIVEASSGVVIFDGTSAQCIWRCTDATVGSETFAVVKV